MKVSVLLAERGMSNVPLGTVSLLSAGLPVVGSRQAAPGGPLISSPHVVAVFFEVELAKCNRPLVIEVELLDQDGHGVQVPGPTGPQELKLTQQLVVTPPIGAPTAFPGHGNIVLELGPGLPLTHGIYKWVVTIDGETKEDWSKQFFVPHPPTPPSFGSTPAAPPA